MHKTRLHSFNGLQQSPAGMLCVQITSSTLLLNYNNYINSETAGQPGDLDLIPAPPLPPMPRQSMIYKSIIPINFPQGNV